MPEDTLAKQMPLLIDVADYILYEPNKDPAFGCRVCDSWVSDFLRFGG